MDVPITQFRKNIFALVNDALAGAEVCITHKGRKLKIVPEGGVPDKLSRITPMDIIAPGVDLEDDSWKKGVMREWEASWDRQLGPVSAASVKAPSAKRGSVRKA